MNTITQNKDKVTINGVKLTVEQVRMLEPTYPDLPSGYTTRVYREGECHEISGPGMVTVQESPVWSHGNQYCSQEAAYRYLVKENAFYDAEITKRVDEELRKRLPKDEARREEYPSTDLLIVALWEHIVEKKSLDSSGITALQELRDVVKKKYPGKKTKKSKD